MADAAADLLIHEYFLMGGASFHHASSGQYQRAARDLPATYAQSSSVFHRRGNALPRSQGLARHGFPALCAGGLHPDVDPAGRGTGPRCDAKCRMAIHVRDHRHVSHSCISVVMSTKTGSCGTAPSSTPCAGITPLITTRG